MLKIVCAEQVLRAAVFGACLALIATPVQASTWTLNAADLTTGVKSQSVSITDGPDAFVTSFSKLSRKNTPQGTIAVGTKGGNVRGEIDALPQFLQFDFSGDVFLNSFRIAWLYPDGEYGDQGNEVAVFETYDTNGNLLNDFFLQAETKTSATLYADQGLSTALLAASIVGTELAQDGRGEGGNAQGGVWEIASSSLFGDFDTLKIFGAMITNTSGKASGSDFSFVSATGAAAVPVPAALPLLLTGLAGLGALRFSRKRRRRE